MKTLQLEVGKTYANREGRFVEIVKNDNHDTYPFEDVDGYSYMPNGRLHSLFEDPRDLIRELDETPTSDPVNHPAHYRAHPSGIECITITEHMGFNLGNAVKYIWRADLKNDAIEDLRKASWYIQREIAKRQAK